MFDLSLVDTLRLAFAQAVYHHKAHTRAASTLARCSRWFRTAETMLLMGVVVCTLGSSFTTGGAGHAYAVTSAVLASLALLAFIIHATFDFESTARAHHICSTRLWSIREQYRALLADIHDGAIESEVARARRNVLMEEVAAMQDRAPALTRRLFKVSPGSADGAEELALSDEEIDRFLPKSLHGSGRPAPASA